MIGYFSVALRDTRRSGDKNGKGGGQRESWAQRLQLFSFWISSNLSSDEDEISSYFSIIAAKNSPSVDVASLSVTCSPCKFSYKKRDSLILPQLHT